MHVKADSMVQDPSLSASKEQKPTRRERPAYDLENAVGPSGEEISFEEVGACFLGQEPLAVPPG